MIQIVNLLKMNSEIEIINLQNLMRQDYVNTKSWIENYWNKPLGQGNFNWLGLADTAAFKAHSYYRAGIVSKSLKCAEIATIVYEKLASESDLSTAESFLQSAMMLRAAMIRNLKSVVGHPVLDKTLITNWFYSNLNVSYKEAKNLAIKWRNLPKKQIKELRSIKNKLNVISVLSENPESQLSEELKAWLSLTKQLP